MYEKLGVHSRTLISRMAYEISVNGWGKGRHTKRSMVSPLKKIYFVKYCNDGVKLVTRRGLPFLALTESWL